MTVNRFGTGSSGGSAAVISADGRFWAFSSFASDLVAYDTNGATDVFVRNLQTGTTTLVSVNQFGTASGNGGSGPAGISVDGRFVVFVSGASDLAANDTNGIYDVFVRDLQMGTTTLVSVNRFGTASGNGGSHSAVISADGHFVAFKSAASDLVVANDTNGLEDVFVRPVAH